MAMIKYSDNVAFKTLLSSLIQSFANSDMMNSNDLNIQLAIAQLLNLINSQSLEFENKNGLPRIVKTFVVFLSQFNITIVNLEIIKLFINKY